jgi:hypothetical protein
MLSSTLCLILHIFNCVFICACVFICLLGFLFEIAEQPEPKSLQYFKCVSTTIGVCVCKQCERLEKETIDNNRPQNHLPTLRRFSAHVRLRVFVRCPLIGQNCYIYCLLNQSENSCTKDCASLHFMTRAATTGNPSNYFL